MKSKCRDGVASKKDIEQTFMAMSAYLVMIHRQQDVGGSRSWLRQIIRNVLHRRHPGSWHGARALPRRFPPFSAEFFQKLSQPMMARRHLCLSDGKRTRRHDLQSPKAAYLAVTYVKSPGWYPTCSWSTKTLFRAFFCHCWQAHL